VGAASSGRSGVGESRATTRSVAESQRHAANIDLAAEQEWARFIDPAYLNGEYAHAFRDPPQVGVATM
jgi:hypothetical protein